MPSMNDVPKYIRYDFLITFLGLLCIGSAWYYQMVIRVDVNSTTILWLIGIPFLLWGFTEMYRNYADEQDLKQLNLILDKKKTFDKILKNKIISKEVGKEFTDYLKEEFNNVFEKSKKRKKKDQTERQLIL